MRKAIKKDDEQLLKLEVGKTYLSQNNEMVKIDKESASNSGDTYPFRGDNGVWYTKYGSGQHGSNLVKEFVNPSISDMYKGSYQFSTDLMDGSDAPFLRGDGVGHIVPLELIRRFKSGAVRSDSTGRPRPDWVSPYAIEEISKVLVGNQQTFGACNYLLGIDEEACLESLMRHTLELQEAMLIKKDAEEAKVIARSVGFNVIALLHTMVLKEKGLYKEVYKDTELVTVEEAKKSNEYLK